MKEEKKNRCLVETENGPIKGTIMKEFEEIGGPDDGAKFAIIHLDNGQEITIKMSEVSKGDD
jgi:hypothetical protein